MRPALLVLLLAALALPAAAQDAGPGALRAHHTFPRAGEVLHVVVEGLLPASPVRLWLHQPADAPPSALALLGRLAAEHGAELVGPEGEVGALALTDELGRLLLALPLHDQDDAGRALLLSLQDERGQRHPLPPLLVQPPQLVLQGATGVVRIDLRDGTLLPPELPGQGELRGAALSADGLHAWILREGGRLQALTGAPWRPGPEVLLPLPGDDLAHGPATGPAFVLVRPDGAPFAPPGHLLFVRDGFPEVLLEPLARPVDGRRWALSDDGRSAFVAEDDLLVREVDLQAGAARGVFSAGFPEDRSIADLAWHDGRLLVLTRRPDGRSGGLSVLDSRTGRLQLFPLEVDPLRLVGLDGGSVLVVPASGHALVVLVDGVPSRTDDTSLYGITGLRDAAPVEGGALLLVHGADGEPRLLRWELATGPRPLFTQPLPQATRAVSGRGSTVVLLGAPDGAVHRVHAGTGELGLVDERLRVAPDAPFVVLP